MSMNERLKQVNEAQDSTYESPFSLKARIGKYLFFIIWALTCRLTPSQFNPWRLLVLRCFGTTISGRPYVAASAEITMPWNVTLDHRACVAPGTTLYSLGPIRLRERSTIAQHSYVCTGSHDVSVPTLPLTVGAIDVGADVLVFAKTFIAPGVVIGTGAVIGAASVVTKDMPEWTICAGNPCRPIRPRKFEGRPEAGQTDTQD